MVGTVGIVVWAAIGSAQDAREAAVTLQAAVVQETIRHDLAGAIALYERAAREAGNGPELAPRAVQALAQAYERAGRLEARGQYERLVRDFPASREADTARARLVARGWTTAQSGGGVPGGSRGDRMVWTGPSLAISSFGRVSPDGRVVTGRDRNGGGLIAHEVRTNKDRPLTASLVPTAYAGRSTFSRDGRQILYEWSEQATGWRMEIRIAPFPEHGTLQPTLTLRPNRDDFPRNPAALDWSPDGRWVALSVSTTTGTGVIALMSVPDGSFRVLKSLGWDVPPNIFFSPDSRYLAYDAPGSRGNAQRDVFVIAIDGTRERAAVAHAADDNVLGWSPDGRWLLFSSNRTGSWDLWGQPVVDGEPRGDARLLRSNIGKSYEGRTRSLGVTAAGALYLHRRVSSRDVVIAPIDLEAGRLVGPARSFAQGPVGGARNPVWSPDGRYLAYACDDGVCIAIRSVATGEVKIVRAFSYASPLRWSRDSRALLANGTDLEGRRATFQIDAQSGHVTRVAPGDDVGPGEWSADGSKVYFMRDNAVRERDLASGSERELSPAPTGTGRRNISAISPRGEYVTIRQQSLGGTSELLLLPLRGGEPRALFRVAAGEMLGRSVWTPDEHAVIVEKDSGKAADGTFAPIRRELWLVPVTGGGAPRKLDIDTTLWTTGAMVPADDGFALSPDGRHLAFLVGSSVDEVWALENFLPRQ
jgi:Tol biopolymer transport system component